MQLRNLLNITTAAMTALGAILLGTAQQDLLLPILAVISAGISVVVTDWLTWIALARPLANGLALLAVAYSAFEFLESNVEFQLLAIANLLIYLQIILLFQKKYDRIYWQIIVLSVLQVVVSAAISLHVAFGFMLVMYLVIVMAELVLFYLYRERQRFLPAADSLAVAHSSGHQPPRYLSVGVELPPTTGRGLWTSRTRPPYVSTLPANAVAMMPVSRIARLAVAFSLATVAIATVVFFSIPRVGESWSGRHPSGQRLVGFSNDVSLDDLGRILDNPAPVMRVSFRDTVTGEPSSLSGEPYFRATMLDRYEPLSGKWTQRRRTLVRRVTGLKSPPSRVGLVRQELQIEPSQQTNVFSVFPIYRSPETRQDIGIDSRTLQLFRTTKDDAAQWEPFQMVGLTNALRFGRMRSLMPCESGGRWAYRQALEMELRLLRAFDEERLGEIQQLATQILDQAGTDRDNPIQVAERLSAYLEDATRFDYSLDQDQPPPEGTDPVQHFLTTSRSGHCEYFASALVLMLRSQDIPARMVIGFKGGDYNTMGDFYQVRQLHAHAWAEAYIPPEFINKSYLVAGENVDAGGWLRLDPTPVDLDANAAAINRQRFAAVSQAHDYLQMLWDKYVVGLNSERQLSAIYAPVAERLGSWWHSGWAHVATAWQSLERQINVRAWHKFRRRWLTWQLLVSYLAVGLIAARVIYRWRRQLAHIGRWWPHLPGWLRGWSTVAGRRPDVGFYRKLEQQLARRGMRRSVGQTHREFAAEAGELLMALPHGKSVAPIPQELVELFYRVRFGRQRLAAHELAQANGSLKALAAFDRETARSTAK